MRRSIFRSLLLGAAIVMAAGAAPAADLTPTESRWFAGIRPVLAFAREQKLPLDIVVQPQPTPGAAPLALAFIEGRCKLVFSMRGNPEAESTLTGIDPELLAPTLELMAAHELGHCRRYLDGAWYGLPAGFAPGADAEAAGDAAETAAARREEGYGDLVGLAWARQRHPEHYARLHAWLLAERRHER
ncbi:MAG: hypothetical protein Q7T55_08665, partial [Solirubrobacteraceae bacterium]|nr:hypothetical protein [Solirubrobacteraceae bacterium]